MMGMFQVLIVALFCASMIQAFAPSMRFNTMTKMRLSERYMSEEEVADEPDFIPPAPNTDGKMFDMNRRVRLGRSRDQDGKSNIWSIEPTMQVVEEDEEGAGGNKNLIVGGAVIAAALAFLPLFQSFSSILPDPADF